jgi:hypothetical protein
VSSYGFGPERAMKFSAAPCEEREQAAFENAVAGDPSPDDLREALTETMKGEDDVCFDFMIQVQSADELKEHHVEDATTAWPDEPSRYERVARITIPAPQDPEAEDVVQHCEAMAFTPWHSLAARRPLGGINRLIPNPLEPFQSVRLAQAAPAAATEPIIRKPYEATGIRRISQASGRPRLSIIPVRHRSRSDIRAAPGRRDPLRLARSSRVDQALAAFRRIPPVVGYPVRSLGGHGAAPPDFSPAAPPPRRRPRTAART